MSNIYQIPILINEDYLKAYSPIPSNFDWSDIRPFVPIAEEAHIVPIIGRELYNELLEEVTENDVTDVNSTLLIRIYQVEAIAVSIEALPFLWGHFSEKGITLGKSENSESITSKDLSVIQNHLISQLTVFKKILKDFLENNADCYPLYVKEDEMCSCSPKQNGNPRLFSTTKITKDKNY